MDDSLPLVAAKHEPQWKQVPFSPTFQILSLEGVRHHTYSHQPSAQKCGGFAWKLHFLEEPYQKDVHTKPANISYLPDTLFPVIRALTGCS